MFFVLKKQTIHSHLFCQAMESKLLVGGKNIIDHTNEQQKMLEMKRTEIAEQVDLFVTLTFLERFLTSNTVMVLLQATPSVHLNS